MMRAAIYARVSTLDQEPENQLLELRRYAEARTWTATEYVDRGVSGAKDRRPALDKLLADARRRRFDVVVVWRLDRLGRNLKHLITLLDELQALGIAFVRLSKQSEAVDLFLSVLADHPDHAEARYQLGRVLLQMGNFAEAIHDLEEVTRLQPARLSVHLDLEAAYRKAGRTAEADRELVLSEALRNRRPTAKSHELKESPI